MKQIKMLVFDIDGVVTDGKCYIGESCEVKSISLKDVDAVRQLQDSGYLVGCISGEDTVFSRRFVQTVLKDEDARLGCKKKDIALADMARQHDLSLESVCYVGDGKYDIPALMAAGFALCPADATEEAKHVSDVVLDRKGGQGCLAEVYTLLMLMKQRDTARKGWEYTIRRRMDEHLSVLKGMMDRSESVRQIREAASLIVECYRRGGRVLICGNGGSAADAQHLAGELVGRFYLERRALDAEALSTDTSVLTSLANDYSYEMVFARQVEAKASLGDVLVGITTSGKSRNIHRAFAQAKLIGVKTILLAGDIASDLDIIRDTDCLVIVPSVDTPRIQEMHILVGHIICELVEQEVAKNTVYS